MITRSRPVVHVSPVLFGNDGIFGGGERYALELAKAMAQRVPTKLVAFGNRRMRQQVGELSIEVVGNLMRGRRFTGNPFSPSMLGPLAKSRIIHCHQPHTLSASFALLAAKVLRRRVYATTLGGGGLSLYRLANVDGWFHKHLHISDFSKSVSGHQETCKADVILGGVDTERFSPDQNRTCNGRVLFVGRLLSHKGIDYLIQAIDSRTPLDIVGRRFPHDGGYYELLCKLATDKPIAFHEDFEDDELIETYRHALCVVLPSVYDNVMGGHTPVPELLGQTLLEGMACGIPAICTRVGAMPEVVEDGVTGFVVPPNDPIALREKILWLKENPTVARQMGDAARQRVLEHFTWDHVVDRCLEAYDNA